MDDGCIEGVELRMGWGQWVDDERDDGSRPTNAVKMRGKQGRGTRGATDSFESVSESGADSRATL